MFDFSLTAFAGKSLVSATLIASALLSGCDKSAVMTQPALEKPVASATAQTPAFTAESFSTKGLTIEAGKDYKVLAKPQPVQQAGKAEVLEFFWYGCGHCYAIEPAVEAWQKTLPANVSFVRYHVQWSDAMKAHQRIAMTVRALNQADALDMKVFKAIQDEGKSLTTDDKISEFMTQNGVDKAAWDGAYKGFAVNANIVKADALFKAYGLEGVPAFIVNGKYLVQGDTARALQVVNKLLEQK